MKPAAGPTSWSKQRSLRIKGVVKKCKRVRYYSGHFESLDNPAATNGRRAATVVDESAQKLMICTSFATFFFPSYTCSDVRHKSFLAQHFSLNPDTIPRDCVSRSATSSFTMFGSHAVFKLIIFGLYLNNGETVTTV